MKDKKKKIIKKRIINKKFNKLLYFFEKEQSKLNSFDKVKEWLNKQENLENLELLADIACQQQKINVENLELLADIACQQQKINVENLKSIHWKKEIININRNSQNNNDKNDLKIDIQSL
ncbi:hypothetical protein [Spiroplasma endosymbiont of Virgichneumon dumeticola]|uniref:hypothetical protein n=1 Tax=Spiroplasma endosymbiont of Virgichneumon dumeticola TaxID=3139323 RepID=UPI0035C8A969